jgi:hypothetical protein
MLRYVSGYRNTHMRVTDYSRSNLRTENHMDHSDAESLTYRHIQRIKLQRNLCSWPFLQGGKKSNIFCIQSTVYNLANVEIKISFIYSWFIYRGDYMEI